MIGYRSLLGLILTGIVFTGCGKNTPPSPAANEASNKLSAAPVTGSLHGVTVSIPPGYLYFPVQYEQEGNWSAASLPHTAAADTPIHSISLRVLLPDMSPKTPQNEKNWNDTLAVYSKHNKWISVDIRATLFNVPEQEWMKRWIDGMKSWIDGAQSKRYFFDWHYKKLDGLQFGLTKEILAGKDKKRAKSLNKDIFYDADNWQTAIECVPKRARRPEKARTCKQYFVLTDMNAFVSFEYPLNKLYDWKLMQQNLANLLRQFVVNNQREVDAAATHAVPDLVHDAQAVE